MLDITFYPFIAGLATDPIPFTQLAHIERATQIIGNEFVLSGP